MKPIDRTGRVFGDLTVISPGIPRGKRLRTTWVCVCTCGKTTEVIGESLRGGKTASCGCKSSRATMGQRFLRHGMSHTPTHNIWSTMLTRCFNPATAKYPLYGGRGITVCQEWLVFEQFLKDMGPRPSSKHSIDRIDNDGPYSAINCRWATSREQVLNRSNTRWLTHGGRTQCLSDWATEFQISVSRLHTLIKTYGQEAAFSRFTKD